MSTLIEELVTELKDLPPLETLSAREEVTLLLERIVAKYGRDYVYPHVDNGRGAGCYYATVEKHFHPTRSGVVETVVYEPSCILGHLLYVKEPKYLEQVVRLDTPDTGEQYNEWGWTPLASEGRDFVPREWAHDKGLIQELADLQTVQDDGVPWGEALDGFKAGLAGRPLPA